MLIDLCALVRLSHGSATVNQIANRSDDLAESLADAKVFEANDDDSFLKKLLVAHGVCSGLVVRTVELDRHFRAWTIEVDDDGADRMLATNGNPQFRSAQLFPEPGFFGRRSASKLTRSFEHLT